jgi:hypothetical protein
MTYPCWTADGSIMATQFGTHSLVVFADDGPRTITPWNIFVGMASASPMASANPRDIIAVFAGQLNNNVDPYNEENNQIWRVNAGGFVQPVDPYQDQGRSPWWHPSGSYIALESKRSGNGYGIYTIFPDGKNLKVPYTEASIDANHPKFSPNGKKWCSRRIIKSAATGMSPSWTRGRRRDRRRRERLEMAAVGAAVDPDPPARRPGELLDHLRRDGWMGIDRKELNNEMQGHGRYAAPRRHADCTSQKC